MQRNLNHHLTQISEAEEFTMLSLRRACIGRQLIVLASRKKPQAKPIARPIPVGFSNSVLKPVLKPQPPMSPPPPQMSPRTAAAVAAERRAAAARRTPPLPLPPVPLESPWIISIREKLDQAGQYEASTNRAIPCIYRVPKRLRDVDKTAYTPQLVSIGPYHRGRSHLREMDRHKWRILYHALARDKHDVRDYLNAACVLEDSARACYEAHLSIPSEAFVECLVLDAIFVLELFRCFCLEGFSELGYSRNDPVCANFSIITSLQLDMIMVENQLPLFVLDHIFSLQLGKPSGDQVASLALEFFNYLRANGDPLPSNAGSSRGLRCVEVLHRSFFPCPKQASRSLPSDTGSSGGLHSLDVFRCCFLPCPKPASCSPPSDAGSSGGLHFLDLFRRSFLPCPKPASPTLPTQSATDMRRRQLIPCVSKLRDAGIKFRSLTSDQFWDIKFNDGVLYIPRLVIYDETKTLFLNLMAFEQFHLKDDQYITSYVAFMDNLIDSKADVGYLRDNEIIEHWLGSDGEVAGMFNRLCREVLFDLNGCYLSDLSKQVNRHCSHKRNTWGASFKHKYFSNPWAISSLIAAVVLLLLTAAQTFYTVYAYYKPN